MCWHGDIEEYAAALLASRRKTQAEVDAIKAKVLATGNRTIATDSNLENDHIATHSDWKNFEEVEVA